MFPLEKCNATGREETFGFSGAVVYETDPTQPIGDIKEAWEGAKRRTRRHCANCKSGLLTDKPKPETGYACIECKAEVQDLPAGLVSVRFHDLRHSAVSRMIAARVPLPIIAKIVGWTTGTMAKMAASYGHFGIEELRVAVEAISSNGAEASVFRAESHNFHYTLKPIPAANALTERKVWSGREDLNLRPPAPKAGALPGCATPRLFCFCDSKPL